MAPEVPKFGAQPPSRARPLPAVKLAPAEAAVKFAPANRRAQALCAIEDKDVWHALIHEVPRHGQGLEVGRDGYLASFYNLAFEFFD